MKTTNDEERAEWWKDAQLAHNHLDQTVIGRMTPVGRILPLAERVQRVVEMLDSYKRQAVGAFLAESRVLQVSEVLGAAGWDGNEGIAAGVRWLVKQRDDAIEHAQTMETAAGEIERRCDAAASALSAERDRVSMAEKEAELYHRQREAVGDELNAVRRDRELWRRTAHQAQERAAETEALLERGTVTMKRMRIAMINVAGLALVTGLVVAGVVCHMAWGRN